MVVIGLKQFADCDGLFPGQIAGRRPLSVSSRLIQKNVCDAIRHIRSKENDRGRCPLGEQYNRLKLIEFYDWAGFRTYHMSASCEAAEPDAIAQRISCCGGVAHQTAAGTPGLCVACHHPLRLAEGICMLDQLSDALNASRGEVASSRHSRFQAAPAPTPGCFCLAR
jgi:hypothetical protein